MNPICNIEKQNDINVLTLTLDALTHEDNNALMKVFDGLLKEGGKKIILDLSGTRYVSSIILASLVYMQKRAKDAGGALIFCNVQNQVKEVIEMTNLDKIFDIVTDRETACKKIK